MRLSQMRGAALSVLSALAILTLVAAPVAAQQQLRWKLQKGQKLDYSMVQDMTMAAEGGPVGKMNTTMRQDMAMTWNVQEVKDNGDAIVRQKIDRVKMKMTTPLGGFEYDSQSEEAPVGLGAMLAPMFKAMTGGEFVITMSPRGEIKDVTVPEEMMTALKNSPGAAMMGDMATSEGFKKMISQGALVLPDKAPKEGEKWSSKIEMKNPMAGTQTVETTYSYEGTKEIDGTTYAVIRPEMKMEIGGAKEGQPGDPPQQPQVPNLQMKISDQSSDGEVLFNISEGRLHSSELNQKFTMDMTAGGQVIKQKIDQKIVVNVKPAGEAGSSKPGAEEE